EAWENVDTRDSELQIESDGIVMDGDSGRLLNLFENLFRNSVEHNASTVEVRVGATDGGFYVEDTGEGIAPDDRDDVLEHGYTTSQEGTGLGLSIVNDIVEGHGWSLEIGESDEGGVRFEVRGSVQRVVEGSHD
ncbi:MAG: HAMP domain-containing sensor histidine kinase, partial [Halobacteria archaeon]|nr:HAMP domain-containing sensor histidine kinase [Halobacteria archaeon]